MQLDIKVGTMTVKLNPLKYYVSQVPLINLHQLRNIKVHQLYFPAQYSRIIKFYNIEIFIPYGIIIVSD